jgi:riboflavin kinase/FMN adenylyltransferase
VLEISLATELPINHSGLAVAIGKFDGVHLGHRQLVHELIEFADEAGYGSCVLTFDRDPKFTLDPASAPRAIIGPNQKAEMLEKIGVDVLFTLVFDKALASLSPEEFVITQLVPLGVKMVFVGKGFRFGSKGAGGISELRELGLKHGFRARELPHVMFGDKRISSTWVRELLEVGDVATASVLLGTNHSVTGEVEHGRKLGRTLGFPTANLARDSEGFLPADGVYAGWLIVDGVRHPAAHSVGTNDSVASVPRLLESHVIGRDDLDLYGQIVRCEFVTRVRGWAKYETLEILVEQIASDVKAASKALGE